MSRLQKAARDMLDFVLDPDMTHNGTVARHQAYLNLQDALAAEQEQPADVYAGVDARTWHHEWAKADSLCLDLAEALAWRLDHPKRVELRHCRSPEEFVALSEEWDKRDVQARALLAKVKP